MALIYCYTGTPGTGKSLHLASELRFQLNRKKPHPVIANFPINTDLVRNPDCFKFVPNDRLNPLDLVDFADGFWQTHEFREEYLTLAIDECQLLFNARNWTSKDRLAWLEFLSQSRKTGYRVILVAQSAKMIDNQFRMLIEYEVNHRRVSNMGIIGALLGLPFRNRLFLFVTSYYQMSERLGSEWYIARRKDMALYDTHVRFERLEGSAFDRSLQYVADPSM